MDIHVQVFTWTQVFIFWNQWPGVKLLGHMVVACLFFKETAKLFSRMDVQFHISTTSPPAMHEWSSFSISLPEFDVFTIFYFSHSDRCVVISHFGFNLHFPDNDVDLITLDIFLWAYLPPVYSPRWNDYSCLMSNFWLNYLLLRLSFVSFQSFVRYTVWRYFLPDCRLSFHPLCLGFCRTNVLILMRSNLWTFSFLDDAFGPRISDKAKWFCPLSCM